MAAALMARSPMVRAGAFALARAAQRLGWHGLAGLALLAVAAIVAGAEWRRTQAVADAPAMPATAPEVAKARPPALRLPPQTDVPLLLSRMQRAAVEQGLSWSRADYRVTAATDDMPALLDVRVTLDGPYLQLRRFVTALLLDAPTLTFRELSLSRANPEAPNVEAKLAIVVYLAPDSAWAKKGSAAR